MTVTDPRELGDRELLLYLVLGDLPRRGWPRRGRAIALRMLQVAILTAGIIAGLAIASVAIILLWAATLPKPA